MNKFLIIFVVFLIITLIFLCTKRYVYIDKDKSKLYVAVKGHNYEWNKNFYDKFLQKEFPDKKEIIIKQISNPDILLISKFYSNEDHLLYIDKNVPYITWSGESERVEQIDNVKAKYNFISQKPTLPNDVWFPYILTVSYLYKERIENIKNRKPIEQRKFLVAYIASNRIEIREKFFNILNTKYHHKGTHALGKCSNNYKKIDGDFTMLDKVYEDYIFGFAMENTVKEGYITEKILNIFVSGAIPIFYGDSKNIEKFFNKKSYIDLNDFKDLEAAADYINELSENVEKLKEIKSVPIFKENEMMDIDYFIKNISKTAYK